jgi:hypothetical protein
LLIDELDLLLTRNQSVIKSSWTYYVLYKLLLCSWEMPNILIFGNLPCSLTFVLIFYQVLYNILDWPTKPNSNLVIIGTYCLDLWFFDLQHIIYSLVCCYWMQV